MKSSICKSEVITLKALKNLFIEMSGKSCNQRCKHCYIDFPEFKKVEDYISIETIKTALNETTNDPIECIYLTGAEPMIHPDFNAILRLCLKRCDVCVCTNGSCINEKKARFLKKVEDECDNDIIFKISIDHYNEIQNDEIRYRGAFRHGIFAIKHLIKYNFTPVITVTNFYKENENTIIDGFENMLKNFDIKIEPSQIVINPYYDKNEDCNEEISEQMRNCDCEFGRVLTSKGVYSCMFLSDDYRGRCGSNFTDYMKKYPLETNCCLICQKTNNPVFGVDIGNNYVI